MDSPQQIEIQADQSELPLTHVQLWMMESLRERISHYGPRPDYLHEGRAIRDLRCDANLYGQEATPVASFNADEIKIYRVV